MSLNVLQVLQRAHQMMGQVNGNISPGADDQVVLLQGYNAMKRAWFGTLIGPRLSAIGLNGANGQAENGGEYMIPGGAAFSLNAPVNPRAGDRFGVIDASLNWATNNLTIAPNGRLINGSASSLVINTSGANARWWFRADTGNWVLEADATSLTSVPEFPDEIIAYLPYMLALAVAASFSGDLTPEVRAAGLEGRAVLARKYGRRGRANPDGPIGLAAPPQQGG